MRFAPPLSNATLNYIWCWWNVNKSVNFLTLTIVFKLKITNLRWFLKKYHLMLPYKDVRPSTVIFWKFFFFKHKRPFPSKIHKYSKQEHRISQNKSERKIQSINKIDVIFSTKKRGEKINFHQTNQLRPADKINDIKKNISCFYFPFSNHVHCLESI